MEQQGRDALADLRALIEAFKDADERFRLALDDLRGERESRAVAFARAAKAYKAEALRRGLQELKEMKEDGVALAFNPELLADIPEEQDESLLKVARLYCEARNAQSAVNEWLVTERTSPLRTERRTGGFSRDLKALVRDIPEGRGYCIGEFRDTKIRCTDRDEEEEEDDAGEDSNSNRVFDWLGLPSFEEIGPHLRKRAGKARGVALAERLTDPIVERIEAMKKAYVLGLEEATFALCRAVIDITAKEWLIRRKATWHAPGDSQDRPIKSGDEIAWSDQRDPTKDTLTTLIRANHPRLKDDPLLKKVSGIRAQANRVLHGPGRSSPPPVTDLEALEITVRFIERLFEDSRPEQKVIAMSETRAK